ncbi:Abnormal spindle microcephaly-associated protein [Phytophthora cinnamomi]|uniref:Abnormal spindle microcephaly-associated protein n=1 Tax=Phytophthora cinnamomi TaxID=4785 RepID=UPI003559B548|nr:Abnormal spindle microcephaly-associated protein [Phytophthora cinnamomi]
MNEEERKALAEARGRVANLRAMFNKGAVQNSEPPAWKRRTAAPPPIKLPGADQPKQQPKPVDKPASGSETLVDAAVQERKLREEQERRAAQESRDAMAKQSSYDLESDRAYTHAVKQMEYVRSAEQKAKESLAQFTSDGKTFEAEKRDEQRRLEELERKKEQDAKALNAATSYSAEYDHSYKHFHKQREGVTRAEQDAQKALRNFAGGKTYFEEQMDEKKRLQELERQKEQNAKEASAKNNFSSPDFDHAYVHAKEVAQVEKEAEEKAKAALLKYDQHDVSHEYVMKNGFMVPKHGAATPNAKRYPFTDPATRIKKPSPQALKALARFQEQLAESRAREERKASDDATRKASWESTRKMSMDSVESMESTRKQSFDEVDIEQIKASVDGAKIDVRSAAQKFAEMDRKAAELAKQNKKPLTFNGVSYGHGARAFRSKDQDRKEAQRKNDMATRIQSRVRGAIAREAYSEKLTAAERIAIRIQTEFRRRQAQKQLEALRQQLEREQTCAVVIQKIVASLRADAAREKENVMAVRLQCQWRSFAAARKVQELRERRQAAEADKIGLQDGHEKPQVRRQPTIAELQLLSQTGRFSNLSSDDDSDDDSEFEDAPSFVDAPLDPEVPVAAHSMEHESKHGDVVADTDSDQSPSPLEDSTPRVSADTVNMALEFSMPVNHSGFNDDKSDASSDTFVDAMEEHKSIEHSLENAGVEENRHWASENNAAFDSTPASNLPAPVTDVAPLSPVNKDAAEEIFDERPSSISDFDRPSSVRSGSFFQEPSFNSDTPRGSLASSSLSGVSRPRDESFVDPFRSRQDSYADSTRSRGDSYADDTRSRNDSYADVFRSRDDSYDDVFRSRGDSYADVPSKSDFDERSLSDVETRDGPKYFDTDSDRASSFLSDSPVSGQNTSDVEKDEAQEEEEQATRKKSGSRWRAASVLSALSSRRSSKPSSSPTSSLEEEDKDGDSKKARSSTLPSVVGLGSVAGMLTRKISLPASNTSSTKSFEEEIEDTFLYSPPSQQASKSKSRFGRFTAPTVSKPAFSTRFAWKKTKSRRGTNADEDDEAADTHAA